MTNEPRLASETNLFKCGTSLVPIILHNKGIRYKLTKRAQKYSIYTSLVQYGLN